MRVAYLFVDEKINIAFSGGMGSLSGAVDFNEVFVLLLNPGMIHNNFEKIHYSSYYNTTQHNTI